MNVFWAAVAFVLALATYVAIKLASSGELERIIGDAMSDDRHRVDQRARRRANRERARAEAVRRYRARRQHPAGLRLMSEEEYLYWAAEDGGEALDGRQR